MKFLIISHVFHKKEGKHWFAYEPYIREMNLWLKYVEEVEILAPKSIEKPSTIEASYTFDNIQFTEIPSIAFISFKVALFSVFKIPLIIFKIFKACKQADHIHLRCPGNTGLLGCFVQICFPKKIKTAKYAGNWDPKAKQPLSYRFQKWILSNTFLTKNMQVLVYGDWPNQTKNIKSFFTASFKNSEKETWLEKDYKKPLQFIFVGSLSSGKQPLLAVKIIETLYNKGERVFLNIYGAGNLKERIQDYIHKKKLDNFIFLQGNQSKETIKKTLRESHFLILPSKSEGWPKAIAEAMFFGVIPITTKVSCLPYMLDHGKRGILIEPNVDNAVLSITEALQNKDLKMMSKLASEWSQQFTLDYFESEIKNLLTHK